MDAVREPSGPLPVTVRPLRLEEIARLARGLAETSESHLRNRWQEQELGFREVLVAERAGSLVGTVSLRHNPRAESMHLFALEVAEKHQGCGIGTAIVLHVIAEARRRQCTRVYLEVRLDNPAKRLYHRLGFRRVGEIFINTWWRYNDDGSRDRQDETSCRMVKRLYPFAFAATR